MNEVYINDFVKQAADMQDIEGVLYIFSQIQAGVASAKIEQEQAVHPAKLLTYLHRTAEQDFSYSYDKSR